MPNSIPCDLLVGLATNGLSSLMAHIMQRPDSSPSLADLLSEGLETASDSFAWAGPGRLEEVCLFLATPEVQNIIDQVFSCRILYRHEPTALDNIEAEFLRLFVLHLGVNISSARRPVHSLFQYLIETCVAVLSRASELGILLGHEALSNVRYRLLKDSLLSVERNLQLLKTRYKPSVREILKFEAEYKSQVADRHRSIVPPNFDSAQKIPLNDIYVSPRFVRVSSATHRPRRRRLESDEWSDAISLSDFLACAYRAVVLGTPGAGKSTLAQKLCVEMGTDSELGTLRGKRICPILVTLRDFASDKAMNKVSIVEFIERLAASRYQIAPPKTAFEYLLLNGRGFVIFDGLDELIDTNQRQEISADVESFCNRYPNVPVLVTSREVGYAEAPLDDKRFMLFRLASFGPAQVEEYAHKWFGLDVDLTPERRKHRISSFLHESRIVPDLRSNPLLLALMCNIFRGENYLPRNRPEVYEKCALMLFERWDKRRGIAVGLSIEGDVSPAMKYLAYWIYENSRLQSGVTERLLVSETAKFLLPRRFEDAETAERASEEFISYCRGRAWVFTDTGTTPSGERLYQFTHRTFLEYFAASHLVRSSRSPVALWNVLRPHILRGEWDVVAQLAIQIQDRNRDGAGIEILVRVLKEARKETRASWAAADFAVRSLEFMVPTPALVRDISRTALEKSLSLGGSPSAREVMVTNDILLETDQLLGHLLVCAKENRPYVADALRRCLEELLAGSESAAANPIWAFATLFGVPHILSGERSDPPEVMVFWKEWSSEILHQHHERLMECVAMSYPLAASAFTARVLSMEDLLHLHGTESLFDPLPSPRSADSIVLPVAYDLLAPRRVVSDREVSALALLSAAFEGMEPPFFRPSGEWWWREILTEADIGSDYADWPSGSVLGAFVLNAADYEIAEILARSRQQGESAQLFPSRHWGGFNDIVQARMGLPVSSSVLEQLVGSMGGGPRSQLALDWIANAVSFVDGSALDPQTA